MNAACLRSAVVLVSASMKGHITVLLIAGLLGVPSIAAAQTTPDQKKLDVMVGKWSIEVDTKATPLSPASKASGTEECQWFANRHVVCRSEAKGSAGTYSQMRTLSYLPARKQYVAYTVDSLGSALVAYGQVSGDTWTFSNDKGDPMTVGDTLRQRLDLFNKFNAEKFTTGFKAVSGAPPK